MESTTIINPDLRRQRVINTLLEQPRSHPESWDNQHQLNSTPQPQQSQKLHEPGKPDLVTTYHFPRLREQRQPRNSHPCINQQQSGGNQFIRQQSPAGVSVQQQKQPPAALTCTSALSHISRSFANTSFQGCFDSTRCGSVTRHVNILSWNDLRFYRGWNCKDQLSLKITGLRSSR